MTDSRSHPQADLGIVDALVQSSFVIQRMLADVAAEHDLSTTQVRLIGILRDRDLRMAQLAYLLGLSKQSVTGLVDRAEQRGLVRRVSIPVGDGRAVHVTITEAGRRLAIAAHAHVAQQVASVAADLSEADRAQLSVLLSQIAARGGAAG